MAGEIPSTSYLLAETRAFVKSYMSQPQFDASHDYSHILRVLALSKHILSVERAAHPSMKYDATVIELCALLHDVADHKYIPSSSSPPAPIPTIPSSIPCTPHTTTTTPLTFLLSLPCPPSTAHTVQDIISAISYSTETRSPTLVQATLRQHPELAIVQDADRLDALGAVGIGRAFTFGGARGERGMQGTVDHFQEKLERLEGMMKTDEGRRMARERKRRVEVFRRWWEEEEGGLA